MNLVVFRIKTLKIDRLCHSRASVSVSSVLLELFLRVRLEKSVSHLARELINQTKMTIQECDPLGASVKRFHPKVERFMI